MKSLKNLFMGHAKKNIALHKVITIFNYKYCFVCVTFSERLRPKSGNKIDDDDDGKTSLFLFVAMYFSQFHYCKYGMKNFICMNSI